MLQATLPQQPLEDVQYALLRFRFDLLQHLTDQLDRRRGVAAVRLARLTVIVRVGGQLELGVAHHRDAVLVDDRTGNDAAATYSSSTTTTATTTDRCRRRRAGMMRSVMVHHVMVVVVQIERLMMVQFAGLVVVVVMV